MRSVTSAIVLFAIVVAAVCPAFGQKGRLTIKKAVDPIDRSIEPDPQPSVAPDSLRVVKPTRRIDPGKIEAEFGNVEGFTEGKGVWIRWRMDLERRNAGFRVYTLSKQGEEPISNLILGSYFTHGDDSYRGGEYYFYDRQGSLNSVYAVEAVGADGSAVRSKFIVPSYVTSIEGIEGGAEMKADTFALKPGMNVAKQDLLVSYDLQVEMRNGLIQPDPVKHREVISQPGARITSKYNGLIRVTRTELQNGGFDVNSDPANWQIYLEGIQLPMIVGPNADYIEFFGKGLDTLESDIRTYYLISGTGPGRRIANQTVRKPVATIVSRRYSQTFTRQDKKNYLSDVLNGQTENWWGDLSASTLFTYNFNLSGIDRTPGTRKLTLAFQGFSITPHVIELTLNGTPLSNLSGSGRFPFSGTFDVPVDLLLEGQNALKFRSVGLGFNPDGSPVGGDFSFLSKLSIDFPRDFVAMSDKLEFYTENYKNAKVSGFSTPNIRVFDVTYENEPRRLTDIPIVQTNGTWGPMMPAARERVLYAVADGIFGTAISVTPNNPSMLADPSNAGGMIFIAHPSFMNEAQTWANYRAGQGVLTKVVDVTDIYDEFSYGVLSSAAIKDFLNFAKNNWQTPPSYVMLFGDAHYDSRNYVSGGYWNMVPSKLVDTLYTETGSDEALSDFNNDGLADIPIGRAASRDAAGITALYNKTVKWEADLNANSLNRGALFAYDLPNGYDFESMSNRVMATLPGSMPKITISRSSATAQTDIIAAINEADGGTSQNPGPNAGQYVLNYTGHGSASSWENTSFFSSFQAPSLTNANYPSLMVALTCLNAYFMGNNETFAEAMTKASNGGAVAVWASTGKTTPDVQEILATRFYTKIGDGSIPRIGDLIADAKAQVPAGADVRLSWALLGDPMLKVR